LFRYNLKNETELGLKAKAYMDKGELVPDDITIAMVMDRISREDCAGGALFDGFPRTLAQAEALDKALGEKGGKINLALNIKVPDEEIVNRLSGRMICRECQEPFHKIFKPFETCPHGKCKGEHLYQRDDDKPETVRNRLEVYWTQTSPLIEYYQGQDALTDINGHQAIDAVTAELKAAVAKL
jgi:adenylate kinase